MTGWGHPGESARRIPRAAYLAGVLILAGAVAVGLVHRPTPAQRASDLAGVLQTLTADVESCAGGVGESLTALHQIQAGASHDVADALSVAGTGAGNCSPANNELIDDLEGYEVPESLASYHLQDAVTGVVAWAAPDAEQVQADVGAVLAAGTPQAQAAADAALARAVRRLNAQRAAIDAVLRPAVTALHPRAGLPRLPG